MRGTFLVGVALVVLAGCEENLSNQPGCAPDIPPISMQLLAPVVTGPDANGYCSIRGEVVRAFRGPYVVGETVTVPVPCLTGQEAIDIGVIDLDPTSLRGAPVIEVTLAEQAGEAAGGASSYGVVPLPAPTETPVWTDFSLICY